jgi:hypothetical protein
MSIQQSLAAFFDLREKRVLGIQRKSAILGKVGQWQFPLLAAIRNYAWKNIPDKWIAKDFEDLLIRRA